MSMPVTAPRISEAAWLDVLAHEEWAEISDGSLVIRRSGPNNPHQRVAQRLAQEFEQQWPQARALTAPAWVLRGVEDTIDLARIPDVLVAGPELLTEHAFYGPGLAAVEVWSPSNSLEEMNRKRREYREVALPIFLEAHLNDAADVSLSWQVNAGVRWDLVAVAVGTTPLRIAGDRPFCVVPNDLLR